MTGLLNRGKLGSAAIALGMITAAFTTEAAADTYKWITFKPQGAGDAQAISTQWFIDEFKKRTGDEHEIEVYWGGSVAKTREIPDSLAAGVGDFGDIVTPYFPDKFPLNNAVGFFIPQPKSTIEISGLMEKWHETYPQFAEELARSNLKAVGFRPLESYGLLCTTPIRSAGDLKGKRIRTYGFAYPALVEALGATPVSVATSEAYEALERSILDCTPIGPALAHGWKYDEVAKYYIEIPLGASFGHLIAMNLDTYNGMDEKTRAIVDQLGKDYAKNYAGELDKTISAVRAGWPEKGVEVIQFPADELIAVIDDERIQNVRKEWIGRAEAAGVPSDEIVEELRF
ncbi:C4-dicarboxylate TRAP transporter substrate-binding protein [Roseibium marinum]|uniref:TRAP-type C4-dicarboxylate transport system substrate-binding protein n=1 Tax=Roseibium marinum TaxID=281252 RepID=A0A2S3UMP9_9HYPH|nr:C4-dicarboxylate TRAP transporter substrate-binding protein [Roseibium marinum]POF28964.1 TRAP-type C4-dicarboxylate transport system substrate-binding protein [Roseibium marinum]